MAVFSIAWAALAVAHVLPPRADYFQWERLLLFAARLVHGIAEFMSWAFLRISGLPSPWAMLVTLSLFGVALGYFIASFHHPSHEARVVFSFAVILNLAFGLAATHAGAILVNAGSTCLSVLDSGQPARVVTYREEGWRPGAFYFLEVGEDAGQRWKQTAWTRLDVAVEDPCNPDNVRAMFPVGG